jgi:hypothetical protein
VKTSIMMMMMMMTMRLIIMMMRMWKVLLNKFRICNTALGAAEVIQLSVLKYNKAVTIATSCTIYSMNSYLVACIQITVDQLLVELDPICEPAPHLAGVKYCCIQTPFL